jgi:hypothetical protein
MTTANVQKTVLEAQRHPERFLMGRGMIIYKFWGGLEHFFVELTC